MMMTAVQFSTKVLVVGAGVAGLQLLQQQNEWAIVFATDVRLVKEQGKV